MGISKRLKIIADLATEGNVVADIGTDHGYVPIYLLREKNIPKVIAVDVSKGSLKKAEQNAEYFHLKTAENQIPENDRALNLNSPDTLPETDIEEDEGTGTEHIIEFRLGDGLSVLKPYEADTVIISGMGGILMTNILEAHKEVSLSLKELILSPHRDAELVRGFLNDCGFEIVFDQVITDKKKSYTILKGVWTQL